VITVKLPARGDPLVSSAQARRIVAQSEAAGHTLAVFDFAGVAVVGPEFVAEVKGGQWRRSLGVIVRAINMSPEVAAVWGS